MLFLLVLVFGLHSWTLAHVFVHQGKSEYLRWISEELETHATVYKSPGETSSLPSFIRNHGLLSQESFAKLLNRAKVAERKLQNRELISKD